MHEFDPGIRDAIDGPARFGGLAGEPESRERRDHDVERVIGRTAVGDRVGERTDESQKVDDQLGHP
ncbi:MAG: hypothetical protein R2723_11430 [Microbacterium sp.]